MTVMKDCRGRKTLGIDVAPYEISAKGLPAWPWTSLSSAWVQRSGRGDLHACGVSNRAEYMLALYEGSLAEPGDHNPYNGKSLLLAKLWHRGYMRMLRVRIETGPAMQAYREARRRQRRLTAAAEVDSTSRRALV
jgi:hypothetical protein